MAKKISQLTQATEVKSDDVTVIVQDGETKKLPLNMMVTKQDIENKKVAGLAKLDEIEATYENDTYTPTITVKNKSSVKVGEGDGVDYSANVMDGHAKSAILKGQTLVNVIDRFWFPGNVNHYFHISLKQYEINKDYLFMIFNAPQEITQIYLGDSNSTMIWRNYTTDFIRNGSTVSLKVACPSNYNGSNIVPHFKFGSSKPSLDEVKQMKAMLIPYQEGMENWDIPYFTGMQSVKMPVLTTTGKQLLNVNDLDSIVSTDGTIPTKPTVIDFENGIVQIEETSRETSKGYKIKVERNKDYIGTCHSTNNEHIRCKILDLNGNRLDEGQEYHSKRTFKFNSGENDYIVVAFTCHTTSKQQVQLALYEGTVLPTTYEPFKSNILSTPEDVVLRGIGGVKDTLDCLTGEVTERIGEIVADGTQSYTYHLSNEEFYTVRIPVTIKPNTSSGLIVCDKLKTITYSNYFDLVDEGVSLYIGDSTTIESVYLSLKKERLNGDSTTVGDVQEWLSQNHLTIQYHLGSESVKTVDLMPSGTHPSTTPYCWKNGHIQLSSSGLLPNLEYSVVTSRAGQINQNATMVVKNDKRIFDLEILLAGGLVNTTYQALTLQNQVETGLSKVSLNSETEPDYLLYHMIMKLIEEKAYKLDDLTEKVSVFYLYEKLSDEQFETIYSALYPFVEDEIVEEPVVEELPEVVEDEVIM